MKKILGFILIFVLSLTLSGCGGKTIATVNGDKISEKTYQAYLDNIIALYEANGMKLTDDDLLQMRSYIVEELINQRLIVQAAHEKGISPTEKEVQKYFEEQLALTYGDAQKGLDLIESSGLDADFFKASYKISLLQTKIAEQLVPESTMTDEEAKTTYEKDPDSWNSREVSHILIQPQSASENPETDESGNTVYTDEEWAEAKAKADDLVTQLNDGADFAELAKNNSADTATATNGGALGSAFTKKENSYVQEFTDASFALEKVGDYTKEPVKTTYGYHIILLTSRVDDSDMSAMIAKIKESQLSQDRQSAFSTLITEKQSAAKIERFDETEDDAADDTTTKDTDTPTDNGATSEDGAATDNTTDSGTTDAGTGE